MRNFNQLLVLIILFTSTFSCSKEKDKDPNVVVGNNGVYIINEGNFQFGNATVSYYDIDSSKVAEDLYKPVNALPLGDVGQTMFLKDDIGYIVVNNSGKIEVVNAKTFKHIATISGFTSPRFFLPVSNAKAYVSDLFADSISIVNLSTNTISGKIALTGWTEEMALVNGKVYVTNEESNKLYVINSFTDKLEDSIQVSYGGNSLQEDKNGKLWVLCGGNFVDIKAGLHIINPQTNTNEKSFEFTDQSNSPYRLKINSTKDKLYFLNQSVYSMSILDNVLPSVPFIASGTHQFYGLGVEPQTGVVYVSDAIDFVQRGRVYRYNSSGTEINNFLAGINPSQFIFQK